MELPSSGFTEPRTPGTEALFWAAGWNQLPRPGVGLTRQAGGGVCEALMGSRGHHPRGTGLTASCGIGTPKTVL